MLKYFLHFILFLLPFFSFSQITLTQDQTDAMIGLDRKNWNMGSTVGHSEGYAHDFTLPAGTSCQKISSIQVIVNVTSYVLNSPPPGCTPNPIYINVYKGCGVYSGGATCSISNLVAEPNYPPGNFPGITTLNYGCPLNGSGLTAEFGDNFSVDIVPVASPGCNSISSGFVALQYTVSVTINFGNITCSSTGCLAGNKTLQPCNDNDPCTINDMQTILNCDGSICIPCAGTPVGPPSTPTFAPLGPYCLNETPASLPLNSTNSPAISGTWSPATINTAVSGTQTYTFTPTAGQCASTTTMDITVNSPITPTFTPLGPYCQNETPASLPLNSTNSPAITGTWSPAMINTAITGTQTYTFTPTAGQCATTTSMNIDITTPPTPAFTQLGPYCQNTMPGTLPLNSTNSPAISGTWSPAVISTAITGTQTYTFTPTAGQCATTTSMNIDITTPPTPAFTQLGPYCQNTMPGTLPLNSTNSPAISGTWSPAVISTAITGTQTYTFTPTAGQCATTTSMNIDITTPPTPAFTQLGPYCQNTMPGTLPLNSTNSPAISGTWSPAVISTAITGTQTYTFTPTAGQCGTTTTMNIDITTPPTPAFTQLGPYCQNTTPGTLPMISNDSPGIIGTWSPAVINTSVPGTQNYTFTPSANQCGVSMTMMITIEAPINTTFDPLGPYCQDETPDLLPLNSNNVPSVAGTWSPNIINTSAAGSQVYTFTPDVGQCGTQVTMTINVIPPALPTFEQLGPYCLNVIPDILATNSNNPIPVTGIWSPEVINTSSVGITVYTFTPSPSECATVATMTVEVSNSVVPTFDQVGPFCVNSSADILPAISNNNIEGTWLPASITTNNIGSSVYTFTPNIGQCGESTTLTVDIVNTVTPAFTPLGPYCQNTTPGVLNSNSTNSPVISGTWNPSVINTAIIGTQVYTFTPNPDQCGSVTSMSITISPPPAPTFTQLGPYCQNSIPGTLPLTSTNVTPITGNWSPAVINTSISGSTVYTFTPNAGQCASTASMNVAVTAPITPTFNPLGPFCLNSTPGILPTSSNNMSPVTGTWSPSVINTGTLGSALYTFTPNVGQCASVTTMTIVVTNSIIPQFTPIAVFCQNETPGILPPNSTNSPSINGTWSPAVVNTSTPGSSIYTFTPSPGQCAESATMTVVVSAPITPEFAQLGPYCLNSISGILPLSSNNSPSINGTWSPSVINTSSVGTQTYTFTPGFGICATETSMNITIKPQVSPTFTPLGPYCQNAMPDALPVSSSNSTPITGLWSPSVVNTSAPGAQMYTFIPNGGQCGNQVTMTIAVTAPLLPTFSQLGPYCLNATPGVLPLSSTNVMPVTGTWSPAAVNTSVIGNTVHTFTPSDGQCALPATMTIEVTNSILPTFAQLGPYCKNTTPDNLSAISLNGIPGTWSPSVINTSSSGSFLYTFTPGAGQCGVVSTMTIVITEPVTPSFLPLGPYCQNQIPGPLPLLSTNTNQISGSWSPSVINTSTPGTQLYTFTPTIGQCATMTSMSIVTETPLLPTFTPLGPFCRNQAPLSLPLASNNPIPVLGTWSPDTVNTSALGSSVYTFTPNAGQCASIASMTITITNPVVPLFSPMGPYCQNTTPGILTTSSLNTPAITGSWSPAIINNATIGTSVYTFTPSAGQCATVTTMNIVISEPPIPTFAQIGPFCQNSIPDILPKISTNIPSISGSWNPSEINTFISGTNVYTFTPATGQCGSALNINISVLNGPTSVASNIIDASCGQSNGSLTTGPISGGLSPYTINFNNLGFGTLTNYTNLSSGIYPLIIQDANGCTYSTTINIGNSGMVCGSDAACEITLPCDDNDPCTQNDTEIKLIADGNICKPCAGVPLDCKTNATKIQPCNDGDPSTVNDVETVLLCNGSICEPCKGEPGSGAVYIPNVFTPNGDGNNDFFTIYSGSDVKTILELKIFDRWGSNLFSALNIPANDPQVGWDGISRGAKVDPGVYVYLAKIEFFDGQVKVRNGTITIAW